MVNSKFCWTALQRPGLVAWFTKLPSFSLPPARFTLDTHAAHMMLFYPVFLALSSLPSSVAVISAFSLAA